MSAAQLPPSPIPNCRPLELTSGFVPLLQQFFDANPEYFLAVQGEPATAGEAHEEIYGELPPGIAFRKKWVIGYVGPDDSMVAVAGLVSDIFAPGVWNVSTFILATSRHGSGDAQALYSSIESWAKANGACWLRLGVVQGNIRAERFWSSRGFVETRKRHGYQIGRQANTLRVMFKPLADGTLEEYLSLVPRDRPETSQAPG